MYLMQSQASADDLQRGQEEGDLDNMPMNSREDPRARLGVLRRFLAGSLLTSDRMARHAGNPDGAKCSCCHIYRGNARIRPNGDGPRCVPWGASKNCSLHVSRMRPWSQVGAAWHRSMLWMISREVWWMSGKIGLRPGTTPAVQIRRGPRSVKSTQTVSHVKFIKMDPHPI